MEAYPCIARWIQEHGMIEFGFCFQSGTTVRVLDEGGMIWSSSRRHASFAAALADCEAGVGRWLREELGESI